VEPSADHRLNILLVDDQPAKLLTYETILADLGENLLKAGTAREALEHLLRSDVAIVLMDVSMPDVDGFELASIIRQHPRCEKTAIIFVSAVHLTDLDRLKGYETGAVDYLPVPVAPQVLRAKIRVLADLHRKTHQLERLNTELERRVVERTEAVQATSERARESEDRFRSLAECMPHLVWEANALAQATFHNQRWYAYTGSTPESSSGDRWQEFLYPDDLVRAREAWSATIAGNGTPGIDYEVRIRRADGVYRWFRVTGQPLRDAHGAVVRWVGTSTDIDERKLAEEALREADRRKDEFLAMLSHELRNPLAPIRNATQLLVGDGLTPASLEWSRGVIERQVAHLTRLVDDLLDVSRISSGKIQLQIGEIDLAGIVSGAVEASRPLVEARKHQLSVTLPPERILVSGDFVRLTQVVSNLLNNAAKFQDAGGRIAITVERAGDDAVIRVRDWGVGIAPEMLSKIFELFAQLENTLDRTEGGLGIGLSLVQRIVTMHGGRVVATSAGLRRGSEFSVHLARLDDRPERRESSGARPLDAESNAGLQVLVVDDNRDAADSLSILLRMRGHRSSVARDGGSAIERALSESPDVILLDLGLPGVDGFEVCRILRERGLTNARIIAITGYAGDQDRRRSREAGFNAHLVKPVDPDALLALLAESRD
jgi:PAS domain S-box-containing protein